MQAEDPMKGLADKYGGTYGGSGVGKTVYNPNSQLEPTNTWFATHWHIVLICAIAFLAFALISLRLRNIERKVTELKG